QDGYLPIPSVHWKHRDFGLRVTAFAQGDHACARTWVRYRLDNPGPEARDYVLALLVQPFQVNPPSQFLNTRGGVAPIRRLRLAAGRADTDAAGPLFRYPQPPDAVLATAFDAGMAIERLVGQGGATLQGAADQASVEDETGLA